FGFNLTEPSHGSDATWLETRAVRDGRDWVINGAKRFASGGGIVQHAIVFARTSGQPGQPLGITAFIVDTSDPRYEIPYFHWTFNMPSDHAEVVLNDLRVPEDAILGEEGRGLETALFFVHENRIRQAASGRASSTQSSASRSASRLQSARRSNGRWSSSPPTSHCCGRSSARRPRR